MEVSFDNLKYLVTVVADDLLISVMKSIFGEKAVISIIVV